MDGIAICTVTVVDFQPCLPSPARLHPTRDSLWELVYNFLSEESEAGHDCITIERSGVGPTRNGRSHRHRPARGAGASIAL